MPPEREEEGPDTCAASGSCILPEWQVADSAAVTQHYFDRFMGEHCTPWLQPRHETRSLYLDPVDAREGEISPSVRERLHADQAVSAWPMPASTTENPSPVWE